LRGSDVGGGGDVGGYLANDRPDTFFGIGIVGDRSAPGDRQVAVSDRHRTAQRDPRSVDARMLEYRLQPFGRHLI
jgi:hypothetical protein